MNQVTHTQPRRRGPSPFEQSVSSWYGKVTRFIKGGALDMAMKNPKEALILAACVILPIGYWGYLPAINGCGGEILGVALVPVRLVSKSGELLSRPLRSWFPNLKSLPSIRNIAHDIFMRQLAPRVEGITSLEELVKTPNLASLAPRIAGMHDLSMPKLLQLLPSDSRKALLRQWLSISETEVGKLGLDGAILQKLGVDSTQITNVHALINDPHFKELAPTLFEVPTEDVLNILQDSPAIRSELVMQMLSGHEQVALLNRFYRDGIKVTPERLETAALRMLCPKIKRVKTLHAFLRMDNLKEIAPRLYGLDATSWSFIDVRALLNADERFVGLPTLENLKGAHAGMMSILLANALGQSRVYGDLIEAGPSDDSNSQILFTMLPLAYTYLRDWWKQKPADAPLQQTHSAAEQQGLQPSLQPPLPPDAVTT